MNQQELLEAILDRTVYVRGGINAKDMDIVDNALSEREELIYMYGKKNFGPVKGKCAELAAKINEIDTQNSKSLALQMDEASEKLFEARRKIKELTTGKKATTQYYGGAGIRQGNALDFKH
ncbi:MAG: hypothetical protein LBI42_00400 [Chitinispirillales bacterium]|jgi:hypothetical protein|nr:hypothetical protein [Chitinispirillales bacterium]